MVLMLILAASGTGRILSLASRAWNRGEAFALPYVQRFLAVDHAPGR
jgi:hypothetical protein